MTNLVATDIEPASAAAPTFCIGVDVGGTFTDVVLSDGARVWRAKAPSSHGAIGDGVIHGCQLVAERAGTTLDTLRGRPARRVWERVGLERSSGFIELGCTVFEELDAEGAVVARAPLEHVSPRRLSSSTMAVVEPVPVVT